MEDYYTQLCMPGVAYNYARSGLQLRQEWLTITPGVAYNYARSGLQLRQEWLTITPGMSHNYELCQECLTLLFTTA